VFAMLKFFSYNWQVRDEWFDWCKQLSDEELFKERVGGVGSILKTLFHIVDVEYSWLRGIQGKDDIIVQFDDYHTLEKVIGLSEQYRMEIEPFLKTFIDENNGKIVRVAWDEGEFLIDEIIHHVIAHEIHHIGQLSVWSREVGLNPVHANFIGRKLD
jgi:uncharacterized damage-inducible protein DinB